jgi:dTDP-4-amino-4,6-dideoxygalactose transaminase
MSGRAGTLATDFDPTVSSNVSLPPKIIGGMFGLPRSLVPSHNPALDQWPFLAAESLGYANARCALYALLSRLTPRRLWVPSYCCPTILQPARVRSIPFQFFAVDGHLQPSPAFVEEVVRGDVVLLIDYFGFPTDAGLSKALRERGAWVIVDASQALLSRHVCVDAHYVLYSPRKMVEVPDGGILVMCNGAEGPLAPENSLLTPWQQVLIEAAIERRDFDLRGGERRWYDLFRQAAAIAPAGLHRMSDLTAAILRTVIPYNEVAARRCRNFELLNQRLRPWGLFQELPNGTVPLGYPIRVKHRRSLCEALFAQAIYPPVHWDLAGVVPAAFTASIELSQETLTIPCDQRYDEADMERVAQAVLQAIQPHGPVHR